MSSDNEPTTGNNGTDAPNSGEETGKNGEGDEKLPNETIGTSTVDEGSKESPPHPPEPEQKKEFPLKLKHLVLFFAATLAIYFIYTGYLSVKRKFMGFNERLRGVQEYCIINEEKFEKLANYRGREYNKNFVEYLEFLIATTPIVREDLRIIFRKNPAQHFKTRNYLLIAGRNKSQYYKNIQKGRYSIKGYRDYLEEAKQFLNENRIYKTPPHKQLGKPFRKSLAIFSSVENIKKAQKNLSFTKSAYRSYSTRLKENRDTLKRLRAEFISWKSKNDEGSKAKSHGGATAETTEQPTTGTQNETNEKNQKKGIISIEGRSRDEISVLFKQNYNRLKLEIKELQKLKQKSYQTYKIAKMRYERLKIQAQKEKTPE